MRKITFISILLLMAGFAVSQTEWRKNGIKVPPTVCYASGKTEKLFIPPPEEFRMKSGNEKKSEFIITYSLVPANAKPALEYAISIWEQIIESDVPIRIQINWRSLETNVLAQAGPNDYYSDFENAPRKNQFYPIPVVEKIIGREISGSSSPDIDATFNNDIKWYLGTDGQTPTELYDLTTVALHEIGHGLGFTGFFFVTGNLGAYGNDQAGDISSFDFMVIDADSRHLTDTTFYQLATRQLYNVFVSEALFSDSQSAKTYSSKDNIRLYAPATWSSGSSIYHLDDATYNAGENSLMTHAIGKGEAVHDPGPITRGILDDVGWKIMKLKIEKPKDTESVKPLVFRLNIDSDNAIDSSLVKLYYSTTSFQTKDSAFFTMGSDPEWLTVTLDPKPGTTKIEYYASVSDVVKRTFSTPSEAPAEVYTVKIGADTEAPVIDHDPIPYFISNGNDMEISALIDDNLGVEKAFVEFSINGTQGKSFELTNDSATVFSGSFGIPSQSLNDGDLVEYRIFAIDSSALKNMTTSPADGFHSFKVEKIFAPVTSYFNDFNSSNPDFVLSDFDIYTAANFENGSLHSPHPYPSPNKNNDSLNFTTILKYPVILKTGGTMSYDEVVLVEPGETLAEYGDDDFWDYVIAEGSKDNGKTWLPLADGYDSGANSTWKTNYNKEITSSESESTAVGISDWYVTHEINLLENGNFEAGDTILIRFRLYSDPYAHGWGWTIDNLSIQSVVSASEITLSPGNLLVYPNPFNDFLNVEIQNENMTGTVEMEILNLYGQSFQKNTEKNLSEEFRFTFNLNDLPPGMYLLIVKTDGKVILHQKIIKSETKN